MSEAATGDSGADLEAMARRAIALLQSGEEAAAEQLCRQVWAGAHPEWSAWAGLQLGELWLHRGELDAAVEILREAIDGWGHPIYGARAAITLGVALANRGDAAAAQQQYQRVADLGDPEFSPLAQFNLAELAHRQGRAAEAVTQYRAVMDSGHPEYGPRAGTNLGVLYTELGELERARITFTAVLTSGHPQQAELARRNLTVLQEAAPAGEPAPGPRPVPPASFDPEGSVVDSLGWIAGDPSDARVQRARAYVLDHYDPPMRHELASLIQAIDAGLVRPEQVSLSRYLRALFTD